MTQFISIFAFQMASCVLLMGSVRKTGSRPSSNHRLLHSFRSRLVIALATAPHFLLLFHGKLTTWIVPRWLLRWFWAVVVLQILVFTVRSNVNITVVLVGHIPSLFFPFLSVLVGTGQTLVVFVPSSLVFAVLIINRNQLDETLPAPVIFILLLSLFLWKMVHRGCCNLLLKY